MESHGRGGRRAVGSIAVSLAVVTLLAVGSLTVNAATVTNAWQAKVGSAGVNGLATIQRQSTGTGTIALKLTKLKHSTLLAVTLPKGTCSSVGSTLIKFPAIKSTSTGAASRTSSLTVGQVNLIKSATKGTGKIAIRVGSKSTGIKCGVFATLSVAPPPAVAATVTVDFVPSDVALTSTAAWIANGTNSLSKIDLGTNSVLSVVPLGQPGAGVPLAVAAGDGAIWVSVLVLDPATKNALPGSVVRVDPVGGQVTATIPVGRNAVDIATSPGAVWAPNYDDGTVSRIDTTTNTVAATITLAVGIAGIAYGEGAVWVSNETTGTVSRIDPATNQVVATIATVGRPAGIAVGPGAVWVANEGSVGGSDGVLSRIDPVSNQVVATVPVGSTPVFVALGGGFVWVTMQGEPTVVQVNATTKLVTARVTVGGPSWGIAATDHAVWTVQQNLAGAQLTPPQQGTVTRINY
jgi:YVTN family beta-propeller protein